MKKLLVCIASFYALYTQELVSTTITPKNVLIEEFTAIGCGNCPTGHSNVKALEIEYPNRIVSIRLHHGGLATTSGQSADLRIDFSSSLTSQAQAVGQPLATINRHLFDRFNRLALNTSNWQNSSQFILDQNSIVKLAAKAILDTNSRIVEITVEIYYTGTQSVSTNQLNVALLQNNIIAPQSNYNQNIEHKFFIGTGMYEHMHVLRHLITGQWGQAINIIDGPFISKKYTYQIPNQYRNLDVDLNDIEFAIFINEDEKEVLTAISITPEFGEIEAANISENENSVVLYPNPIQLGEKISIKTKNKDVDQILKLDVTGKKYIKIKTFIRMLN